MTLGCAESPNTAGPLRSQIAVDEVVVPGAGAARGRGSGGEGGLVEVMLVDHGPLMSHETGAACESEGPKVTR